MATKRAKRDVSSMKGLTAAEFMRKLGGVQGLTDLNDKEDSFFSFGDPVIDRALGGGLQRGQFFCIRGQKGTGKSLISLGIAREVCEEGGSVAYFDTENKISRRALERVGLAPYLGSSFQFLTIDTQKDAIDVVMQMIQTGIFQLVVIDSINGLYTEEQEERDIHEESKVGGYQAKVWSEYLPMMKQRAAETGTSLLLVQQARDSLAGMYGPTETYSGGKAIEHFATTIVRLGTNKKGNDVVDGSVVRQGITVSIRKNNMGSLPDAPIETRLYIGEDGRWGVDELTSVFDESVRLGVLAPKRKGAASYVPCGELCERLGMDAKSLTFNGRARVMAALEGDEALYDAVKTLVVEANDGKVDIHPSTEDARGVDFEDEGGTDFEE